VPAVSFRSAAWGWMAGGGGVSGAFIAASASGAATVAGF
jgi:hypothetical protein